MKSAFFFAIACAVAIHIGVIFFGGFLVGSQHDGTSKLQEVELMTEADAVTEEKKIEEEPKTEETEELENETEEAPDAAEMIRNMEVTPQNNAPELEAASLSAIEAALSGQTGSGGDFAEALSFSSGGRIGGTGKAGLEQDLDNAFSLSEIDQKPRAIFQASPIYPTEMKKVEGVVTVIFVVDETGKVKHPLVEKSTHREFEKPALDAVKQWKFEPAVKSGQKVSCKMRVPIRFQPR